MKRLKYPLLVAGLVAVLVSSTSAAALDFTPVKMWSVEDGITHLRFAFHEGETQIFFEPLKGYKMSGGGDEITFTAPSLDGQVRLGNSKIAPSVSFDEENLHSYRSDARELLPDNAIFTQVVSETPNAFPVDGWESFETRIAYTLLGVKKIRSVLYVTMNSNRQVRLVADGDQKDFEKIQAAARTLLGSWYQPPPGLLAATRAN